jgi:hypothetical protein
MGQRIQSWQINRGEKAWLSMLVASMEDAGRAERRAEPCDKHSLAALRAQLALPAQATLVSRFSLRN